LRLDFSDPFPIFVHLVDCSVGVVRVLRFLEHAQKDELLLSEPVCNFSGHKSSDRFLDIDHLFILKVFCIIGVKIFLFLSLFLFGYFFYLSFLIVGSLQSSHDTLPTSFYFLDNSDCGFHVGVQCGSFFYDLLFG
jgi:hypothetical protein